MNSRRGVVSRAWGVDSCSLSGLGHELGLLHLSETVRFTADGAHVLGLRRSDGRAFGPRQLGLSRSDRRASPNAAFH